MSGQTISTSETRVEALKLQSSAYGATIPFVCGVTKISGNLVWYGGFKAIPHTTEQGGKGGGVTVQNTTYSYKASVIMGLCHGQITGIPRIWRGKKLFQGGVTPSQVLTASENYTTPSSGAMTYTLTHAATYAALIRLTVPGSGLEPWSRTLQLGIDYNIAAGVLTILQDRWRSMVVTIVYQYISGSVVNTALSELGLTFLKGAVAQAAWSALTAFPSDRIGYSGLAAVAGQEYDLGTGAQIENHMFEVVGPMAYHLGAAVPDVDPSLVLTEVCTNIRAGAGVSPDFFDSMAAWSDFCVASGLLISPAITEQVQAAEVLRTMAKLTNTGPVWSGGRMKMVPYADTAATGNGRTFTPATTPVYDLDDECYIPRSPGDSPVRVELKSPAERFNHVRVEYLNRANQYTPDVAEAKDQADIDSSGLRTMDTVRAHWICEGATAQLVAQMLLQRSLYVCATYQAPLPWHFALLEPMDLVTLTDARLEMDKLPVRVMVIEEDEEGDLQMEFEDYPAGQASAALYPSQVGIGFAHDYNAAPGNADAPVIFEVPVERTLTGLALYVAVKGSGANWGGAQVWVSQDGTNYKMIGVVYGGARAGTLSANASAGASSIAVQGLGTAQLVSGSAADATALNTLCYVGGTNPEYLAYQTATLTGAGAYTLGGLVHGAYGTSALAHSSGDLFVRVDERVAKSDDLDLTMIGKTISVKLCSFNIYGGAQQGLADVSATNYTITGVMASIPPADVAGLQAGAIPGAVRILWTPNAERDYAGTELRRGANWAAGTRLDGSAGSTFVAASTYDWAWPPSGTYNILARHRDTTGNLSSGTASYSVVAEPDTINATTDLVFVRSSGIEMVGNAAYKTGVSNAWDQSIRSREGIVGGAYITAVPAQSNLYAAFGLNSDPTTDSDYTSIDYAAYLNNGDLYIFESGDNKGLLTTYVAGDTIGVAYDGADVVYTKNGVEMRRVGVPLGLRLYADSSFFSPGFRLESIKFGPLSAVAGITTRRLGANSATVVAVARAAYAEAVLSGGAPGDVTVTMCTLSYVNDTAAAVPIQVETSFYDAYLTNDPNITAKELLFTQTGAVEGAETALVEQFGSPPTIGNFPGFARAWQYTLAAGATITCAFKVRVAGNATTCKVSCDAPLLRLSAILR